MPHRRTYFGDWIVSRARTSRPLSFYYTSNLTCVTQVQRENSRFRALMAAQLSAAGGEQVPEPVTVRAIRHGDGHGDSDEVLLRGEESSQSEDTGAARALP